MALPVLFGVAVLLGIGRGFAGPALSALGAEPGAEGGSAERHRALLDRLADRDDRRSGDRRLFLRGAAGAALCCIVVLLLGASLLALSFIGHVPRSPIVGAQRPIGQIVDGLRYVGRNKVVLGSITLDLFAVFLAGATALFPVYARDILQVGASGLSQLAAAPAVGAALTALIFSFRPLRSQVGPKMLAAVAVFAVATIVFGLSKSMPLSLAALFVVGAADMFSVYIRQSLIQLHTPDDKRGRVSSVSMLTISASNEFGDFFSGSLAFLIGPVAAVVAGGAGALAVTAAWTGLFPALRRARTFEPAGELMEETPEQKLQESIP